MSKFEMLRLESLDSIVEGKSDQSQDSSNISSTSNDEKSQGN
jgi:hypothetical protein